MTESGAPHDPPEGGDHKTDPDPQPAAWSGFPERNRAQQPDATEKSTSGDEEPSRFASTSSTGSAVKATEYTPDPDTDPGMAVPIPLAVAVAAPSEPDFRPSARPRVSRRLEEERRILDDNRPLSYFTRRTGILDVLVAFLFVAIGYFSVVTTYNGFGRSWDEALYYQGALKAAVWVLGALGGERELLTAEAIETYWGGPFEGELRPEVGPVPKLVSGFGYLLLTEGGVSPINAGRIPVAGAFGLTLALIYLMGAKEFGRFGGFMAAFAYLLMPRVFGHAHIGASETLLAFTIALTTWAYLAGLVRWQWAIFLTAPAFALAMGTKVNSFFLPIPLIIWGQLYRRRDYGSNIFAMLILAPVMLVAIWPWLWHGGPQKLLSFLDFYASHQSTAVFYQGRQWGYGRPPAPWHYPFVITLVILPLWIAVLAGVGFVRAGLQFFTRPVPVLFLMMAAMFLVISALPGSPKYDGERLFFPAFMFIALLAGGGFSGLAAAVREAALSAYHSPGTDLKVVARSQNFAWTLTLALFVIWGGYVVFRAHPNQISYFNKWMAGGSAGAEERGLETNYWGEALNEEVTEWLRQHVEPGQKVKVMALEGLAFQQLQQWGKLSEDVNFGPTAPPYDWYILQNRKGFFGNLERSLFSKKPFKVFEFEGVPRILVYTGDALPLPAPDPVQVPVPVSPEPGPPEPAPPAPVVPEPGPTETPTPITDEATTEPVYEGFGTPTIPTVWQATAPAVPADPAAPEVAVPQTVPSAEPQAAPQQSGIQVEFQ